MVGIFERWKIGVRIMDKMKIRTGRILAVLAALLIALGAAWGTWRDAQPKFRDVTISAGEEMPLLEDYFTEFAVAGKCEFVTDLSGLDGFSVGDHEVVLRQGQRQETVTLHIVDTLAPELEVQDLEVALGTQITTEDLITHLWDHTQVTVAFAREPEIPDNYSDLTLEVIATDTSGNTSTASATVSFVWMRTELTVEFGTVLTAADILYDAEKDADLLSQEDLDRINQEGVGQYEITSTAQGRSLVCRVTVQDTQGPVLVLQEHQEYLRGSVRLEDFLVSAEDLSGEVTVTLLTTHDCSVEGPQTVRVEAKDIYGNTTVAETTLYVVTDVTAPVISGGNDTLSVPKNTQPNYLAGVSARDDRDGAVNVTVDDSKVDLTTAGTYFVTYIARDSSGNEAKLRRKVIVEHDAEDTAALVAAIAATLENDPEKIRDYVRSSIRYSTDWGGDDPVWKGFTDKSGNCYVHALCLKAILDLKGYNTQLIWVTNKTHYWLIIEMEPGVWRHIDPTPSDLHSRYSLMTDQQRLWTLSGRDWDHSQWPACE